MITLIIYDIVSNKIRNKVIRLCKDYGLYRVQKSVFLGKIEKSYFEEIHIKISNLINHEKDSVYIFLINQLEFKKSKLLGQKFDKDLVTNDTITIFF